MKLHQGELKDIIECIKIAKQVGEKDFNELTTKTLAKLEKMYEEEVNYQLKD